MKYSVQYTVVTKDPEREPKLTISSEVELYQEDEPFYGNGYHMAITGKDELFGMSVYDIRYDKDFYPEKPMAYIADYYSRRFTGKPNPYNKYTYRLVGINIEEVRGE